MLQKNISKNKIFLYLRLVFLTLDDDRFQKNITPFRQHGTSTKHTKTNSIRVA